jgi:hypothetical protein
MQFRLNHRLHLFLHVHQGLSTTPHGALRQLNKGQSRQELSWDLKKKLWNYVIAL